MTLIQILVLALIQGLTEFLPVSSSAHLILGGKMFGWPDQGLVFDVATHLGTLLAVLVYFRRELVDMAMAMMRPPATPAGQQARNLGWVLVAASVPVIVAGALMHDWVEHYLRDVRVIAWTTIGFGILLWVADRRAVPQKTLERMDLRSGLMIGLAQVLALVPGASRSGVTIMMGRFQGFNADAAARFSFLLSIPVIGAAGSYGLLRMMSADAPLDWFEFGLAVAVSAVAGWVCIAAFLALLRIAGLLPFILYRLALGVVLLILTF
jgi:undecaprenyl-diphosphatase